MRPHSSGYNSHARSSSFQASQRRNNNQNEPQTPRNRAQENAQLDWEGLGDRQRANVSQNPADTQPTEQSQDPFRTDLQDILQNDAFMRQRDYTDHLESASGSSSALHPYFQSPQQQACVQTEYLGYEPASQTPHGSSDLSESYDPHSSMTVAPNEAWEDYTLPTEPTSETSVELTELAQLEDLLQNDNLPLSPQHQTERSQPREIPEEPHLAQSFENSQPAVVVYGFGPVVYQRQFLAGFSEQRIIYMQAQLASLVPYREVFADQHPLRWAMLAHALGHALPPRQDIGNLDGSIAPLWLPSQAQYSNWDLYDAGLLQYACLKNEIRVNWGLLDQIGIQAQLMLGPPPSEAPYGTQQAYDPRSQAIQTPALSRSPPEAEVQANEMHQAEDLRELSSSRGEDRTEPVTNPMESLEDPTLLEPGALDHLLLYNSLLDHGVFTPAPLSSQPSAAAPQPTGDIAMAAAQPAQTQQPQQTTAAQTSLDTKTPRKQKELKRLAYDSNVMLRPRSNASAVIRLTTQASRAAYTADIAWYQPKDPVEIHKVPGTDKELEPYVEYMLESMMDTSQADDKKDVKSSFHKRWSDEALAKKWPVSIEAMEAICWIIAKMTRRYHRDGPAFLNLFDKLHQDKANKNQDLTFAQRISAICTVLLVSKARVDTCLKHENLGSLVAFPLSVLSNCIANRPFNDERKAKLAAGAKWLEREANKAEKKAASKKGSKTPISAHGQTGSGGTEEDGEADSDIEEEKEEDDGPDENEDHDEDEDGDGSDDESGNDGAGNGTGTSQPYATPGEELDSNLGGLPAADTVTQNGTQVSFHSMDHLANIIAPSSSHPSVAQHAAAPARLTTSAQTSVSRPSRKRSATDHLGLALPSAPKRPRNATYADSDSVSTYGTPRNDTEPVPSPKKRSATEAGLSDSNTREKSAHSVDREVIAPTRRRAPTSSAD